MTSALKRHAPSIPAILAGLLMLFTLGVTGCDETGSGNARCRLKALGPVAEETLPADFSKPGRPRPKPKPKPTRTRVAPACTKANSPIWRSLKPYRGAIKTDGKPGKAAHYYKWDYTHGDIEKFDHIGNHLGSIHPRSGKLIKGPVKGRSIKEELR